MKIERGDIYTANLSPIQESEQGGIRPVIIFQKNTISQLWKLFLKLNFNL